MTTPLAISAPVAEGPHRTADVFATVLDFLGKPLPGPIDGILRRLTPLARPGAGHTEDQSAHRSR